jgi:mono/diheme cytochrome c family protein
MLANAQFVVAGLATSHKIGLAAVAIAFIAFALVSSFVFPRRSPNFPGRHLGLYVTVCVLFFVGTIAAVLVFGKERSSASESPAHTATVSKPLPAQTTAAPTPSTTTTAATTTSAGAATKGDPAAGKSVFASAGCGGCHTLKAANASGNVGPNLDTVKPSEDKIVHQVENGGGPMPAFKGQLSATQIQDVAAFVYASTHS